MLLVLMVFLVLVLVIVTTIMIVDSQATLVNSVRDLVLGQHSYGSALSYYIGSVYSAASRYGYDGVTRVLASGFAGLPLLPECSMHDAIAAAGGGYDRVYEVLNEYRNLVEGLEKDLGVRLPYLSYREIRGLMDSAGRGSVEALQTLCGLARDYNGLVRAANLVLMYDSGWAWSWFYGNLTRLVLDIVLIRLDPTYGLAFKVVGKVFTSTGLARVILEYGGYAALEYSMSLSHWQLRHKIHEIIEENVANPDRIIHSLQEYLGLGP
ncbi:hypothetical protein Pyrde_0853 [Pyrodictium delaneyi]|uniref:Uncharacterized protein n=1 Tax=Pyrodictium delaneyi TaxID=1273541 RepID=A0A0P0N2H3_9CREN|nr:hypothetical protein Pyrde_0853 [Pyrodictium delaneyi]OWJ55479.1 hypothetical protein Pdsh_01385 [Pyrodictium delaneyi]